LFPAMDFINRLDEKTLWRVFSEFSEEERVDILRFVCIRWKCLLAKPKLTTIDDLNGDCLVELLSKLPMAHLVTSACLVNKKWHNLIPAVHNKRQSLQVVSVHHSEAGKPNRLWLIDPCQKVSSSTFQLYHSALFD